MMMTLKEGAFDFMANMDEENNKEALVPHRAEDLTPEKFSGDNVRASFPVSADDLRKHVAHCTPDRKDALISVFHWCIDPAHPVSRYELAARLGYSENVLYRIMCGKYLNEEKKPYDIPADLAKACRSFLKLEKERHLAGGRRVFVETPTSKRIFNACDLARESQTPVYIIGPSHIGKTWALEYFRAENNHGRTFYCRMNAASGLGGMVRSIAKSCGVSERANTAALIERITRALNQDSLLILDEMHLLTYTYRVGSFFSCIEVIRQIYDKTECGLVLCGTELLLKTMDEGKHGEMEQMLRRGVHKYKLLEPQKGDLLPILESAGLDFPEPKYQVTIKNKKGLPCYTDKPYELLRQLAKQSGLKAICERLRYAQKLANKAGHKLTWADFLTAQMAILQQSHMESDWDLKEGGR